MQTRCPQCDATFRVTPEQLRIAQGSVRCGNCGAVFDALNTLSDNPSDPMHRPAQPAPSDSPPIESAQEPDAPLDAAASDDPEVVNFDEVSDQLSGYFDDATPVPPAETDADEAADAIAAEGDTKPRTADAESTVVINPGTGPNWSMAPATDSVVAATPDDDEWLRRFFEDTDDEDSKPVFVVDGEPPDLVDSPMPDDDAVDAAPEGTGVPLIEERADQVEPQRPASDWYGPLPGDEPLADDEADPDTVDEELLPADAGLPEWPELRSSPDANRAKQDTQQQRKWAIAGGVLLATLLTQLVHTNRDAIATHDDGYGRAIRSIYSAVGLPLYPEWDLRAYEIRGSEAVSGETGQGVLDIRAQIGIKGTAAVGQPLIRVALRDRWANLVASGIFNPAEYLVNRSESGSMLDPGALVPVNISVADPGSEAQGYELDVCVQTRHTGLQCDTKVTR